VKSFLGLCSFFRRTIPNFSLIALPLTKLTRQDSNWKSGALPSDALKSFHILKQKLCERPCLAPVDFDREFIITVDASSKALGCILSQVGADGIERPNAFASRSLNATEVKYAPTHLESLAILWACRHFKPYLVGKHFTIRTDHKPLMALNKANGYALDRINAELQEYLPYTIKYLKGSEMPADGLSRLPSINLIDKKQLPWIMDLSMEQLLKLQQDDKWIKALVCYKRFNLRPNNPSLWNYVQGLKEAVEFEKGVAGIRKNGLFLALAPYHLRASLLNLAHDDKLSGHLGWEKTYGRLQLAWYWPNMRQDIIDYCRSCHICQSVNNPHSKRPVAMRGLPPVTRFNERVCATEYHAGVKFI